jgi:ankyrin repeat protein
MLFCGRAQQDRTPLYFAAEDGRLEVVRLLLDKGAEKDVNATTNVRAPSATAAARRVGAWRARGSFTHLLWCSRA